MKNLLLALLISISLSGCGSLRNEVSEEQIVVAAIDLVNVQNDRVMVSVDPARFKTENTTFYIPKTVPGTYSTSNFGQYVEDLQAYDYKGKELQVVRVDENTWSIANAQDLDKVSYWVNDTFDVDGEGGIYSMAGTNILEDENFLLNLHGFVGYFQDLKEEPYRLEITRPSALIPGSALNVAETSPTTTPNALKDTYLLNRYFEVTDNPIMYATPDTTSFDVEGMKVLLNVYSPNNKFSSEDFKPDMERMVQAQKRFLGDIDNTDKYAILLYLSATPGEGDAGNFGALEHHTSTVVVMPETMEREALAKSLVDIVSHEFFHIITPLGIHSDEVHYFDYNDPKMSQHLWLYEGVTEYFANLFQVNQGLITNQEFYDRINEKRNTASNFDDTMSFTEMSKNILDEEYQNSYYNVYQKGALIGMALDIRLRELSNGQMGLIDLMKKLTQLYGKDKPFNDEELFDVITEMTYPEIGEFFDTYIVGTTPIPYNKFFDKVGLELKETEIPVGYFLKNQSVPYISVTQTGEVVLRNDIELNSFLKDLGAKQGDIIKSINGQAYNVQNIYDLVTTSLQWKEGDDIKMTISRNGEEIVLESKVTEATDTGLRLVEKMSADGEEIELRHTWLKS